MKKCQTIAIFCIFALLFVVSSLSSCFAVDVNEATNSINQAEFHLNSAIATLVEANQKGVVVDPLLDKIKVAELYLSEANLLLGANDYTTANMFALNCSSAVEGLPEEVDILTAKAERTKNDRLFFTVMGSTIALVVLLILSIVGWQVIKKWYFK